MSTPVAPRTAASGSDTATIDAITIDAAGLTRAIADNLADPTTRTAGDPPWWRQSLADGALAVALLHVERARAGLAPRQRAHDWLAYAASAPIDAGPDSHLHYGAPALAFVLHTATHDNPSGSGRYARVLATLDRRVAALTRRRLDLAHARIDRREAATMTEFDAIRGLTGLGALWLRRAPHGDLVRAVLTYLVRLTEPIDHRGETRPGWWTHLAPNGRLAPEFPDGHANNGVAHGIGGPLALLSIAARRGVHVDGQSAAIRRICAWLDRWRQDTAQGPWWPHWITRTELRAGYSTATRPGRPSWCYGAAGLGRAQQLAGIALDDITRRRLAETALHSTTAAERLATLRDASICHGHSGLLHILTRAAADAACADLTTDPRAVLAEILTRDAITELAEPELTRSGPVGLFEGAAGTALALHTASAETTTPTGTEWDACLVTN